MQVIYMKAYPAPTVLLLYGSRSYKFKNYVTESLENRYGNKNEPRI